MGGQQSISPRTKNPEQIEFGDLKSLHHDLERSLSVSVSSFISRLIQRPPLKLRLMDLYYRFYNLLLGPWGRIVGSYADCLSLSSSDIDIILDDMEAVLPSSINQSIVSTSNNIQSNNLLHSIEVKGSNSNQPNISILENSQFNDLLHSKEVRESNSNKSNLSTSANKQSNDLLQSLEVGESNTSNMHRSLLSSFERNSSSFVKHDEMKALQNNNGGTKTFVVFTDDKDIPPGCCWLVAYEKDGEQFMSSKSDTCTFHRKNPISKNSKEIEVKLVDRKDFKCLSSLTYLKSEETFGLTSYPMLNKLLPRRLPHGPAFKQTYFGLFEVDVIQCFTCKSLPEVLCRWAERRRKHWPSAQTIQLAMSQGCHVVGLPSKISTDDLSEKEWRFGYGKMEKVLIDSLNSQQKQCFMLLKIILKEYIEPQFPEEDMLSSFIMKMVIFWIAEETEEDIWTPNNLLNCLRMCMERLNKWIQSKNCPNYFIPEYNLFRTKLERMNRVSFAAWFQTCVDLDWRILIECKTTKQIVLQGVKMDRIK